MKSDFPNYRPVKIHDKMMLCFSLPCYTRGRITSMCVLRRTPVEVKALVKCIAAKDKRTAVNWEQSQLGHERLYLSFA